MSQQDDCVNQIPNGRRIQPLSLPHYPMFVRISAIVSRVLYFPYYGVNHELVHLPAFLVRSILIMSAAILLFLALRIFRVV